MLEIVEKKDSMNSDPNKMGMNKGRYNAQIKYNTGMI